MDPIVYNNLMRLIENMLIDETNHFDYQTKNLKRLQEKIQRYSFDNPQ